jgi:hypothetical protein
MLIFLDKILHDTGADAFFLFRIARQKLWQKHFRRLALFKEGNK